MSKNFNYNINLDIKCKSLELIDIPKIISDNKEQWFNQSLVTVNNSVVRVAIIEGEFHWHKHVNDDEFFYVIDGKLLIDLEDKTVELNPREGFMVPKNVMHKTRAPQKTVILMVENVGVTPTGDQNEC
jgi:mannose-6-phosphate isomerase-like protein (cupin superfamily)